MTKHLAWVSSCAWLALMGIVWALFVPKGLSVGTFTLLSLSGPLFLLTAMKLSRAHRPARSRRQAQADAEAN